MKVRRKIIVYIATSADGYIARSRYLTQEIRFQKFCYTL
jgi:hypothetical protein